MIFCYFFKQLKPVVKTRDCTGLMYRPYISLEIQVYTIHNDACKLLQAGASFVSGQKVTSL